MYIGSIHHLYYFGHWLFWFDRIHIFPSILIMNSEIGMEFTLKCDPMYVDTFDILISIISVRNIQFQKRKNEEEKMNWYIFRKYMYQFELDDTVIWSGSNGFQVNIDESSTTTKLIGVSSLICVTVFFCFSIHSYKENVLIILNYSFDLITHFRWPRHWFVVSPTIDA